MGYKLFFDKSPDKVVCTILSQNIYTHLHTFAPLSIWNHAMLLNFCSQYFHYKTASGTSGFLLAVSISFFSLPPPIIFDHNQIKFGESPYIRAPAPKKRLAVQKVQILLNCHLPDIASHGFRRFGFQIELGKKILPYTNLKECK